ncbi:MAG: hypothetical protein NT062_15815 [Proteobacteria bacterium]|nr:hypothetical protein [Pseudomonadota bacterium]
MKLVALALVALAGSAHADVRAQVEAAIRAHGTSFGKSPIVGVAKAGLVYLDADEEKPDNATSFGNNLLLNFASSPGGATIGALTIVVDEPAKVAWFQAPATIKYKEYVGEGITGWAKPRAVRMSGLLVDDGGWKLARVIYTNSIADKDLVDSAAYEDPPLKPADGPAKLTGDAAIAKVAETWFAPSGGFGKGASTTPTIVVNGTAPSEFAAGSAAAMKLARSWDLLKLGAVTIEATAFGTMGFVRAKVRLPVKKGKTTLATDLTLYAIVVDEGKSGWKWQSINWSSR